MNREEKGILLQELHEKFAKAKVAVLSEYSKLRVEEMAEVRKDIRTANGEFKVVKNTIAVKAIEGTDFDKIGDYFKGPIVISLGYDDPIAPIKVLKKHIDKNKDKLTMKVGIVEGIVVEDDRLREITGLPGREVLVSNFLGSIQSPASRFASVFKGMLIKLACSLNAVQNKKTTQQ
ncbi:MAG: 50S ribosomal protein L10 [Nitrospirota bacterium]